MPLLPLHKRAFILLLIAVTAGFGLVLEEYAVAIFWGVVFAIVFAPLHRKLLMRMPNKPTLAALATLLISLVMVILPLSLIGLSLIKETAAIYDRISSGNLSAGSYVEQVFNALPSWLTPWMEKLHLGTLEEIQTKLSNIALQASKLAATKAVGLGQNTLGFVVGFGVMLYLIFFLLRDGKELVARIWAATPLAPEHKRELAIKFITVIRATVKGNLAVAAAQGALGGLIFWILGIQGAVLWAVVMAFLSLLPAVGAGLVWGPVAIYFLATGAVTKGLILAAYGVLVIGLVDNVLRPLLVGKDTKMPDYVVLISTLGGMALFGLSGFVLGPAIAALFMAAWELFATMQEQEEKLLNREIAQKRTTTDPQQPVEGPAPTVAPPPAETRKSDTD
ncbi:AI-2E family transporter [Comamonas thiooxydans]|uniref:AI-2E family transporter n=2 Tax=Comamonas thiooxydans TaxID=363952 RepID=A0AA42Q104_9BURK|nr:MULTISPECIES: AI-2E family transporter [Comamonas]MDH1335302.1 AI-2E family transporter [Comamonas thiooxydans]MDH1473395.1 AI-2E family transporter [Comamonas thiooxydans]MDH1741785.1 AI-2E family transporter [Comamonas thiooxydans]MDH1787632.1 AI-2E family transporter [Comamonas thiooxydans]TFF63054.1 AI-2E family transporter [Comamonas sp. A23]